MATRVVILPGNGCTDVREANWYGWLEERLASDGRLRPVLEEMPDPHRARRRIWLPFIEEKLLDNGAKAAETVVVGHSSGAEAALRLAETTKVAGLVLVAACHTDLGEPNEAQAGWYPPAGGEWQWGSIRANSGPKGGNILLLHSLDDPFIPIAEPRHVAQQLAVELRESEGHSHFFEPSEKILNAVYDVAERSQSA
eukprot:TRINITY_DN3288_c1_g2_i1.p1 TRINITY_DN3288_c1_g2~~TRINITY_DN3288_c1_g2_i1.p1  ORF type:complete len:217 (+),score=69.29 TRINITY_DN3288_c1_g2_i1:63-653(+)